MQNEMPAKKTALENSKDQKENCHLGNCLDDSFRTKAHTQGPRSVFWVASSIKNKKKYLYYSFTEGPNVACDIYGCTTTTSNLHGIVYNLLACAKTTNLLCIVQT